SDHDYRTVLQDQNPWWASGAVPGSLAPAAERAIVERLVRVLSLNTPRRFRLILGPRRVGKTTVMYQMVRRLLAEGVPKDRVLWFRLDHPLHIRQSLGRVIDDACSSAGASDATPAYLFLDEVTYAEDWDLWLKTAYDEHKPVRIVATSSAVAALRNKRMESGIGRWEEYYLAPYLFNEYLSLTGKPLPLQLGRTLAETLAAVADESVPVGLDQELRRFLFTGGFPELLLHAESLARDEAAALIESQRVLRADAVERVVWKDIPQAMPVENPMVLERLLYVLGGQIGSIMSPESICATVRDLSTPTFERYVKYLELAYTIFTLQNYSPKEETRQRRGRKVYFTEGAVRNAALQRGLTPMTSPEEMGLLYENAVAAHLHTLAQHGEGPTRYWRDSGHEVDFIYDHPKGPVAIDVGSSTSHGRAGLARFAERHARFESATYLAIPRLSRGTPPGASRIGEIPIELLLAAIGAHADASLLRRVGG
ncbi:MAG: ATP-binding protein, partial [Phycisphaerales bacterium]